MDPFAELTVLAWIAGLSVVLMVGWSIHTLRRERSTPHDRESTSARSPAAVDYEPQRVGAMRTADIERILQGAIDDLVRPRGR